MACFVDILPVLKGGEDVNSARALIADPKLLPSSDTIIIN